MGNVAAPLRVALVAPPWYSLPPDGYGGIEAVVADLANGLTAGGHEVFLIGAGQARVDARVRYRRTLAEAPGWPPDDRPTERLHNAAVVELIREIGPDLVHDHWIRPAAHTSDYGVPTVLTVTSPLESGWSTYESSPSPGAHLVALSKAHQRRLQDNGYRCAHVVGNGLDVESFPFTEQKGEHVLFLGRFSPHKGAHLAIAAALRAGMPIKLAGRATEPEEIGYLAELKRSAAGRADVQFLGEAGYERKRQLLAEARCVLFPATWPEPFGMVMTEAQACGTPVVALDQGAAAEVIADGETGFVCAWDERLAKRDPDAERAAAERLATALGRVGGLSRRACRDRVTRQFSVPTMVAAYERVYAAVRSSEERVNSKEFDDLVHY